MPQTAVVGANVDDSRTTNRRWCGKAKISDLKEHAHVRLQGDAFIRGQGEHFVVIHNLSRLACLAAFFARRMLNRPLP